MTDPLPLLRRLIEAKSLSHEEGPAAEVVEAALRDAGCEPRRKQNNVWAAKGRGGRALLLNSHIDTVPAGPGWTRDPWRGEVDGDRLYGLGSTDAKSCVAAMLAAFVEAPDPGERGRLVFCASAGEEVGGEEGLARVLADGDLGPLEMAVVGEPTAFGVCHSQRGRVVAVLVAEGKAGHASRPWQGVNAIDIAARDILKLDELRMQASGGGFTATPSLDETLPDPGLPVTVQATVISGGTRSNVIPERCEVTLDIRTTTLHPNRWAIDTLRKLVASRVLVRSAACEPVFTMPDAPIVRAGLRAPGTKTASFYGVSDLYHLASRGVSGIILGPGSGKQSHQADEFVSISAVRRAVAVYGSIVEEVFRA